MEFPFQLRCIMCQVFIFIMLVVALLAVTVPAAATEDGRQSDSVINQIIAFKERTEGPVRVLTTSAGAPVPYHEATNTLNTPLINNEYFMELSTHNNREIIPERINHGRGVGAFGYFEVTHDISHICKANFLNKVGKKTPIAMRISETVLERGNPDLKRSIRGFSVKFYTEEGNFDIAGNNLPVYFYKDPVLFTGFLHAFRRNPATNLPDPNMFWDLITLVPEALHSILRLYSDIGIPAGYRNVPGFGLHTYQVENKCGDYHFIKFYILPDSGIKTLTSEKARNISALDPDYLTRRFVREIGSGDYPTWSVSVQILTESDVKKVEYDVFDVTRQIPLKEFPLHPLGKLVLNRNAKNFFADIEQLAFSPENLVPGILGAPDKLYESRRLAYRDHQLYRLGTNFNKITVNCPFQVRAFTYNRDGAPPVLDNEGDIPDYYPNSFHGPVPYMRNRLSSLITIIEKKSDNFDQAREFYDSELKSDERTRLIANLLFTLQQVTIPIQERAVKLLTCIHPELGHRVAEGLNITFYNKK